MSAHDDMALPAGFTCADCVSFQRCQGFIGPEHIHDKQTRCYWSPSRFGISKVALQRRVDTVTEDNAALRRALQELVRLKALSDRIDKDQATMAEQRDYRENKPLAWEEARACLAAISQEEG